MLALLVALLALYLALPFIFQAAGAQAALERELRTFFQGSLDFRQVALVTFPRLALVVKAPHLTKDFPNSYRLQLHGRALRATPRLLPLFFKKVEFRSIDLQDGALSVSPYGSGPSDAPAFSLSGAEVRLIDFALPASASFSLKGRLGSSGPKNLFLKGRFHQKRVMRAGAPVDRLWLVLEGRAEGADLGTLAALFPASARPQLTGQGDLRIALQTEPDFQIKGQVAVNAAELSYTGAGAEVGLGPFDGSLKGSYQPDGSRIHVEQLSVESPLVKLAGSGSLALQNPIGSSPLDVRLDVSRLDAARLAQLTETGASRAEGSLAGRVFATGPLSAVRLKGGVEATSAALNFGSGGKPFFQKPAGTLLESDFELLLQGGTELTGDLNARLGDITAKGTLPRFDLSKGSGELTLLTNKFHLDPLSDWLVGIRPVSLTGQLKVLANLRGPWARPSELAVESNVTFDGVNLFCQGTKLIESFSGSLDLSALGLFLRKASFHFPGEPALSGEASLDLARTGRFVARFENETTRLFAQGLWPYGVLSAPAAPLARPPAGAAFEAKGLPLGLFTSIGRSGPIVSGRFFAAGVWREIGSRTARGMVKGLLRDSEAEGTFMISKGEIHVVDLLSEMGLSGKVAAFGPVAKGSTTFESLEAAFLVHARGASFPDVKLTSSRLNARASGEVTWQGQIEADAKLFLSQALIGRLLGDDTPAELLSIPFHVSGSVTKPQVRVEESGLGETLGSILQSKVGKLPGPLAAAGAGSAAPTGESEVSAEPSTPTSELIDTGLKILDAILASKEDKQNQP